YLPGSLQGKISSDGCLKKEQMVVSAIASTPQGISLVLIQAVCCSIASIISSRVTNDVLIVPPEQKR
ncbi:hypothetical protein, partial [Escherichia coli]|uniref:hypothetical protein n=1 Tax=Escherichia coli TaxID=562 RepID=UPI001BDA75EA